MFTIFASTIELSAKSAVSTEPAGSCNDPDMVKLGEEISVAVRGPTARLSRLPCAKLIVTPGVSVTPLKSFHLLSLASLTNPV